MVFCLVIQNTENLPRKPTLTLNILLGLSFIISLTLFIHLSMECIHLYQIKSTNKLISDQISQSLSPFESTYKGRHRPMGVNNNFQYKMNEADNKDDKLDET